LSVIRVRLAEALCFGRQFAAPPHLYVARMTAADRAGDHALAECAPIGGVRSARWRSERDLHVVRK